MAQQMPLDLANLSEIERANVELVSNFLATWHVPSETDVSFLAEDGRFRMHDGQEPPLKASEVAESMLTAMGPLARVEVAIHETFAKGTLVANSRTDIVKVPGEKDRIFEVAAHFVCRDGKIVEWTDHVYSWREGT